MAITQAEKTVEPCRWPTMESIEEHLRHARRVVDSARHAAADAVSGAEVTISRHPRRAIGAAVVAGVCGGLIGFGVGWFMHTRG